MNEKALGALYPFLSGEAPDTEALEASLLASIRHKAADSIDVKRDFFERNGERLLAMARGIAAVYERNGRLFSMGNGGSSCDAAHIAVEFSHPITTGRPALPAINLTADTAMLTAVGNDVGIEHIFVRPLIAQARAGDGLIGISTSGNSANLIAAFAAARKLGVRTFGLAGGDGGAMAEAGVIDHCLVVDSRSVHRVQETHVAIYHVIWDLVHTLLADSRGSKPTGPAA